VSDTAWNQHPIDRLVYSQLDAKKLSPSARADRSDWLRRVHYDLTGLPPTEKEASAFLNTVSPDFEQVVDALLASPHFGERWARMWLDAVRYADSNGQDENLSMSNAWRYRDWVVQAFNQDMPLHDFLQHQLAGDLINGGSTQEQRERLIATGFLVIGPKILAEQDKEKMVMDIIDEQIDTTGRAMLGISLGCARCHDHKYDPVSIQEYYALAGIFHSTRTMENRDHVSRWNERDISSETDKKNAAAYQARKREQQNVLAAFQKEADGRLRNQLLDQAVKDLLTTKEEPESTWSKLQQEFPALAAVPADELRTFISNQEAHTEASRFTPGHQGWGLQGKGKAVRNIPHRPELEPETFTIEARIRLDRRIEGTTDSRRWIVNKNQNEWVAGHYALFIDNGIVGAYIAPEGGREKQTRVSKETPLLQPGKGWVHIAMTYGEQKLAVWAGGKKLGQAEVDRMRQPNTFPLRIGGREDGYSYFEEGAIDTVRMYDRVLTTTELAQRASHHPQEITEGLILREDFEPVNDTEARAAATAGLAARLYGKNGPLARDEKKWSEADKTQLKKLQAEAKELASAPEIPQALAVNDLTGKPVPVSIRGDHLNRESATVPRGFPTRLHPDGPSYTIPTDQSGRRELAQWVSDQNPLTQRVWVNRIWQSLFGQGLVRTPDNFGLSGEAPTHPELLDWLASEFMRGGGSSKNLIRQIVLSRTYAAGAIPANAHSQEHDPDARWLSRMPTKRLSAEMIRDTLFAVSGELDRTLGGSVHDFENRKYVQSEEAAYKHPRRTLYLPVIRDRVNPLLSTFDFSNASASCSQRQESIVAMQALFFLNAPVVSEQAAQWATHLLQQEDDLDTRVTQAYLSLFTRPPTPSELERAKTFLQQHPESDEALRWTDFCHTLFATNEAIYLH
jgi:hypothetical protein